MKVLVTGAAGFIGSHLVEALASAGHELVAVDNFNSHLYPAAAKRRNAAAIAKVSPILEVDVTDAEAVESILDKNIEVVCHLAALAGVRPSLSEPGDYIHNNLTGLSVLLERMKAVGVQRMVFASSSSVYGSRENNGQAFLEADPCLKQSSPYAMTKRAGELLAGTYNELYGIGFSCLRFFTVYGPRQRHDMAIHKFVHAIRDGEPIQLFGDGQSRRDYTFISDIIAGTRAACESVQAGSFNTYNLGGTSTTSLSQLVSLIEKTVGKTADISYAPTQLGDVPITFADIRNSASDLGYAPKTDIAEGIELYWDWVQTQPNESR